MNDSLKHGEKSFCIKSIKRLVPVPNITPSENFNFSDALESVYPLLHIIFDYLDCNDLRTCSKVNKTWKDVAENMLIKRVQSSWFTCYKSEKSNIFEYSYNLNYNNVGFGIIFYDFRRIKLNKFICIHSLWGELSRKSVPEYFEDELVPYKTNYCVISCPKVISLFNIKGKNLCQASYFDGLFFPNIPNIRMTMFHCNPVKKENLQNITEAYINSNEEIKCLLMFSTTDQKKSIYNLLKLLIPENEASTVAVGGGIIRGTKTFRQIQPPTYATKRIYSCNDIFSIVFLKERDVQAEFNAFSYVIFGDDLSKDEFTEEIMKFKQQILLRTNTVALRICCSAKIDADEEPLLFSKIFPGIPIFGFHADGEIGWNCILTTSKREDLEESSAKKAKHKYPKVSHQWSTVFVRLWAFLSTGPWAIALKDIS
ncbi:uncharacterized protein LOC130449715 isoform X1 [Diorhabda sublineata]|uniref:uncharacterized protein LOC130449715 isoform X1 n=1 Tax=Diorhabda sublineata TaxID=1163346 RepID=UPI0024E0BF13|nr:uncharacterized protein LOC130449715 isoform X1 [Diorhabda sublineata]